MNAYSISKLADDACVSVHVVRDYMIRGLLHPARRTESGYNIFDDKTLGRLRFLRAAFESGIGLDRAGTHAGSSQAGPAVCKGSTNWRDFAKHWTQTIAKAWTDASSACDGRSTCVEQF